MRQVLGQLLSQGLGWNPEQRVGRGSPQHPPPHFHWGKGLQFSLCLTICWPMMQRLNKQQMKALGVVPKPVDCREPEAS